MQKFVAVDEFLGSLDANKRAQVEALRGIIMGAETGLTEHIKWNAPSYVWNGQDRITFNLLNKEGVVKLVLHMGGSRVENRKAEPVLRDATGHVEWVSDVRGTLSFKDLDDITSKHGAITSVLKDWLAIKP